MRRDFSAHFDRKALLSEFQSGKIGPHTEPYFLSELVDYINAIILPLCKERGQV